MSTGAEHDLCRLELSAAKPNVTTWMLGFAALSSNLRDS